MQLARRHFIGRRAAWNRVLFSGDSQFALCHADGRSPHERALSGLLRAGKGSIWWGQFDSLGVLMGGQKTDMVVMQGNLNARRYIDDVLRPHVILFLHRQGPGVTFQHDNTRTHTALITRQFQAQNNVDVLPCPAVSPDLNPIEHVWDELGRRAKKNHQINTLQDLQIALTQE